jgi:hypothetical protein
VAKEVDAAQLLLCRLDDPLDIVTLRDIRCQGCHVATMLLQLIGRGEQRGLATGNQQHAGTSRNE